MKITIESTTDLITCNGILMRVWNGETEGGTKVKCLVTAVIINKNEKTREEFEDSLSLNPDIDFPGLADLNPLPPIDELDNTHHGKKQVFNNY